MISVGGGDVWLNGDGTIGLAVGDSELDSDAIAESSGARFGDNGEMASKLGQLQKGLVSCTDRLVSYAFHGVGTD